MRSRVDCRGRIDATRGGSRGGGWTLRLISVTMICAAGSKRRHHHTVIGSKPGMITIRPKTLPASSVPHTDERGDTNAHTHNTQYTGPCSPCTTRRNHPSPILRDSFFTCGRADEGVLLEVVERNVSSKGHPVHLGHLSGLLVMKKSSVSIPFC